MNCYGENFPRLKESLTPDRAQARTPGPPDLFVVLKEIRVGTAHQFTALENRVALG